MKAADPLGAASEWDATFRDDLEGFLDERSIERAIDRHRPLELPPRNDTYDYYRAFVDASGGATGGDAYTLAIAHCENGRYIIDLARGVVGPFDPVEVTKAYAQLCRRYAINSVSGDKYALAWVETTWLRESVSFAHCEQPHPTTISKLSRCLPPDWFQSLTIRF
jgi:hypothetical protein